MRKFIYPIVISFIFLLLNACTPAPHQPEELKKYEFYIFGTVVGISLWDVPKEKADAVIQDIVAELQVMHKRWHAWEESSLTALNQAIATDKTWTTTDDSIIKLLELAKHYYTISNGLFNPAIGQLVKLWGFHNNKLPTGDLPVEEEIAKLVALKPTMDDVQIDKNQVYSTNSAVQLDFGAFAKGYAVDLAIEQLKEAGIENAIVNAGGNLKAIGKAGNRPWMTGLKNPIEANKVIAAIPLEKEMAVVTSGNYERFRKYGEKRYSHIIDPRTGLPLQNPGKKLVSVTVLDESATLADAAATALIVAGLDNWHKVAKQMGIKNVVLIDEEGTIYINPDMAMMIQFQPKKEPKTFITEPLR